VVETKVGKNTWKEDPIRVAAGPLDLPTGSGEELVETPAGRFRCRWILLDGGIGKAWYTDEVPGRLVRCDLQLDAGDVMLILIGFEGKK